jgi:hypothetical protein
MSQPRRRRRPASATSEDRAWISYSERFRREVLPQLLSSAICLAVWEGDDVVSDVRFATQIGMMLLHDKPIVLTYRPGHPPPARLARVADEVIELDAADPTSQDRFADLLARLRGLAPEPPG